MANTLASPTMGFQTYGRMEGGSPTAGMMPAWIASTDATLIFRGDPVVTSSAGGTNLSGNYITSLQTTQPSSGWMVRGIFQGCEQYNPTVGRVVWSNWYGGSITGSTGDIKCWIIDDPDQLFLIQGSTNAAITSSFVGLNAGVTLNTSTGNQTTGYSNVTLASSFVTAGVLVSTAAIPSALAGMPFRIVDFYSAFAAPAVPAIGSAAFINGTDNTTPANMVMVRLNNCDRTNLTARSS